MLKFVGIDVASGDQESPTVWIDEENRELVLQGWKPGPELEAQCQAFAAPGHMPGIPAHEAVIRLPLRMVSVLRKACDMLTAVGAAGVR